VGLKYEPSSEPLHIFTQKLFLSSEVYRSVQAIIDERDDLKEELIFPLLSPTKY
jgi:hypothetical protein